MDCKSDDMIGSGTTLAGPGINCKVKPEEGVLVGDSVLKILDSGPLPDGLNSLFLDGYMMRDAGIMWQDVVMQERGSLLKHAGLTLTACKGLQQILR